MFSYQELLAYFPSNQFPDFSFIHGRECLLTWHLITGRYLSTTERWTSLQWLHLALMSMCVIITISPHHNHNDCSRCVCVSFVLLDCLLFEEMLDFSGWKQFPLPWIPLWAHWEFLNHPDIQISTFRQVFTPEALNEESSSSQSDSPVTQPIEGQVRS